MAKIYNIINSTRERQEKKCYTFDINAQHTIVDSSNTYNEVLRIFREAFSLIDVSKIIKKL